MCDTKTEAISATVAQILKLEKEGCDIIRVAIPNEKAAKAISKIKRRIHIPLVADIHFDPALALEAIAQGADKIRINPGNINDKDILTKIIKTAKKHKTQIRIGINSGSLERRLIDKHGGPTPEALVESALNWVKFFELQKFPTANRKNLTISIKSSDVETTIQANELLHKKLQKRKTQCPIHLGVTEAGPLIPGITRSAIALGHLLRQGIGDTIRISLTANPIQEIKAAKELLKALGLYTKEPMIISCPTCGRTEINLKKLVKEVEEKVLPLLRKCPGSSPKTPHFRKGVPEVPPKHPTSGRRISTKTARPLKIAVMGCAVNGPGEAREADYAICGGKRLGAIYKKGKHIKTVPEKDLVKELIKLIQ
jgi:(E)-4-hydroxy-3-methylbut-2-enyl-diphosphate synthase